MIDFDASGRIGIDYSGKLLTLNNYVCINYELMSWVNLIAAMKYSSAYLSPEFIGVSDEGVAFVKSPSEVAWRTDEGMIVYEPVYAAASHDYW